MPFGLISGLLNYKSNNDANKQNQRAYEYERDNNMYNSQYSRQLLNNYIDSNGDLSNAFKNTIPQTNGFSVDTMTPYLNLKSMQMAQDLQTHNIDMDNKDYAMAQSAFDMQKDLAYNGVQRRVEDLKKSGLSPLFATGQAASGSFTTSNSGASGSGFGVSPQNITSAGSPNQKGSNIDLGSLANLMSISSDTDVKSAQADLLRAQADTERNRPENIKADTDLKSKQAENAVYQSDYIKAQTKEAYQRLNNLIEQAHLTRSQTSMLNKEFERLVSDMEINNKFGIRSSDAIPFNILRINQILDTVGIDKNSTFGKSIAGVLASILLFKSK